MAERGSRGKSASIPLDEKYVFASEAEKENRIGTGYKDGTDPADNSPTFKQIDGAITGKDMNDPMASGSTKSGDFKFSGGV